VRRFFVVKGKKKSGMIALQRHVEIEHEVEAEVERARIDEHLRAKGLDADGG
jgi:hypothetical protein